MENPHPPATSGGLLQPGALLTILTSPFRLAKKLQMLYTSQVDKEPLPVMYKSAMEPALILSNPLFRLFSIPLSVMVMPPPWQLLALESNTHFVVFFEGNTGKKTLFSAPVHDTDLKNIVNPADEMAV